MNTQRAPLSLVKSNFVYHVYNFAALSVTL